MTKFLFLILKNRKRYFFFIKSAFFPPAEAAILFQDRLYFSHKNGLEMNMDDRKGLNHFVVIILAGFYLFKFSLVYELTKIVQP